jgi:iron complex transport system substrate-binding protein
VWLHGRDAGAAFCLWAVLAYPATIPAAVPRDRTAAPVPQRIVAIAPNSAEIICALGACDRIVGVGKFCVYPPDLENRTRVGGLFDPDLEKIVGLRPDLVVLRGRSEPLECLCRDHKIAVYLDKTDKLADIETCIKELGDLLDRKEDAARLVEQFRGRLEAVRSRVAGRLRPRVLLTVSRHPDRLANLLTTGRGTFLDEMIDITGGTNVFGHIDMMYPEVSAEAIIAQRPDVIIELMPEVKLTPALQQQMLKQWQALASVPAVSSDRIYFLTDDYCLIPSPRYVEIIEKVSRLLHPEAYVDR